MGLLLRLALAPASILLARALRGVERGLPSEDEVAELIAEGFRR